MANLGVVRDRGNYYLREEGERVRNIMRYGKQKPVFRPADLSLGFCEDLITKQASKSVDLIIDDPPYGTTSASWDKEPDWKQLAPEYRRVLKDDGQIVMFGKTKSLIPVYNAFTDAGLDFRFELIWKKDHNPWTSSQQPISIHENIYVFQKSQTKVSNLTFNTDEIRRDAAYICPSCDEKKSRGSWSRTRQSDDSMPETQGSWQDGYESEGGEDRYPISYLNEDVLKFTSVSGTHDEYSGFAGQKPTDLLMWIVKAMTNRGDTVLDPHAGSGSTAAACIPLCCDSIGYELSPERYSGAQARVDSVLDKFRGRKHADVADSADIDSAPDAAPADD
jgi:site-specific DNA-methyltransferase (adenine-specific)